MTFSAPWFLGLTASALIAIGVVSAAYLALGLPQSAIRIAARRYQERLQSDLRFLQASIISRNIVLAQVALAAIILLSIFISREWLFSPALLVVVIGPGIWLQTQRQKRIARVEEQLDSWLLTLANALKATASLGEAITSSAAMMHPPISQEIDLLIKEYKLGTPLDQAMRSMAERIGSRTVASGLLTLRIARNTGGDLPKTLETAAASLREMARLEGVVRTKTAEGKAQTVVIAAIPIPLFGLIHWIDPNLLRPLATTFTGHVIVAIAVALWLAAILVAYKVLQVDI
jgi:tight adherence protein B